MKILLVGAELYHVDRRKDGWTYGKADMTKLIDAFRNFAEPTKTFNAP
jgi:hypothetical protein